MDSLDSQQVGFPNANPPVSGTNRNFSYYFGLNNFFNENGVTDTGDTTAASAINMSMQSRLLQNPNLISLGQLTQSPPDNGVPQYTYEHSPSANDVITRLAALGSTGINFTAAGGLGNITSTLNGYAGQILSVAASKASNADSTFNSVNTIMTGLNQQLTASSGVDLDKELANTIIIQNAYSASARVITVANSLFNTLISAFQG